jgi:hypothetical protein
MSCRLIHNNTANHKTKSEIEKIWLSRLSEDHLQQSQQERDSIVRWLLGEARENWDHLSAEQQETDKQSFNRRYQILKQRYLHVAATQAYRHLVNRLSSVVVLQYDLQNWIAANRDGQRALLEIVQNVVQEMLNSDSYLRQQMSWIAQCTADETLRDRLLLASLEEYCLRPVQKHPLFIDRLIGHLRRHQHQKNALLLLKPLRLEEVTHPAELHQFSKVMVEIRYPLISA